MEEQRLIDLEIRLTHQEATLQTLNQVVAEHQRTIDQLRKQVEGLQRQLHEAAPSNVAAPWEEMPPPHY